jgi:hypothetical protein
MARKSKLPLGAKASFVRANPSATAQEIIKLAKKEGMTLTAGHVYNIRAEDKKKQTPGVDGQEAAAPTARRSRASSGDSAQLDAQLRTLVIRIGLDRAERVFSELKSSLSTFA